MGTVEKCCRLETAAVETREYSTEVTVADGDAAIQQTRDK